MQMNIKLTVITFFMLLSGCSNSNDLLRNRTEYFSGVWELKQDGTVLRIYTKEKDGGLHWELKEGDKVGGIARIILKNNSGGKFNYDNKSKVLLFGYDSYKDSENLIHEKSVQVPVVTFNENKIDVALGELKFYFEKAPAIPDILDTQP